jgi:hypothetical protein
VGTANHTSASTGSTFVGAGKSQLPSSYGVEYREDGLVVTGPGTFNIWATGDAPLNMRSALESSKQITFFVELDVVGSTRPIVIPSTLHRIGNRKEPPPFEGIGQFRLSSNDA